MDHTKILNAYLSRLTTADLENILKHDRKCLEQMLNGNNSAQLDAQAGFYAAVANAVNNMAAYDIALIERAIAQDQTLSKTEQWVKQVNKDIREGLA